MTRNEWHETAKFRRLRILGNLVAEMQTKSQQVRDMMAVLHAEDGPLVGDAFDLAERQLRIVELEIKSLWGRIDRVQSIMSPKCSDDSI